MPSKNQKFGNEGESTAIALLKRKGYEIITRNYRYQKSEIDIIARLGNELVFVEVKSRSTGYYGDPMDAVDRKKEKLIAFAADHFVESQNLDVEVRYDVITILSENGHEVVEHIEDAFYPFDRL